MGVRLAVGFSLAAWDLGLVPHAKSLSKSLPMLEFKTGRSEARLTLRRSSMSSCRGTWVAQRGSRYQRGWRCDVPSLQLERTCLVYKSSIPNNPFL